MTLKEAIQKDGQRHLYVKSIITSGTTQYMTCSLYYFWVFKFDIKFIFVIHLISNLNTKFFRKLSIVEKNTYYKKYVSR